MAKKRTKRLGFEKRSAQEAQEIQQLQAAIEAGAPPPGINPLSLPASNAVDGGEIQAANTSYAAARKFDELPLSRYTKEALKQAKYVELTAIQRAALPHALAGRDVLGAAKTGSGKTLAFLIPLLEKLYRERWNKYDGLGGLIITPTRELALQIFQQLRRVGARHDFSAGLLIGGKDVKEEVGRVNVLNVLVCTPGRLLQHMDETPGFDTTNLQVLVLDEADRILDMGFSKTMDAIIANLPTHRQTMLFSATQTKSVKDLARLSLSDPEYLAVHEAAATPTPVKLQQAYMIVQADDKLNTLWSFIRTHLKAKMIVFLSTCKQVRYVHEVFKRLRPGVPLRCLHGHMNQYKRMGCYEEFCESRAMVLFATDIAARGLDFPTVDWVVQVDCPEDTATYIHRVGRTARYVAAGKALMFLLPSEHKMVEKLGAAQVPLKSLRSNPEKLQSITTALQALLAKNEQLKEWAQRALTAYLKSVFLQPDKGVFDVLAVDVEGLATSMGLPSVPKLKFLQRERYRQAAKRGGESHGGVGGVGGVGGQEQGGQKDGMIRGEDEEDDEEGFGGKRQQQRVKGEGSKKGEKQASSHRGLHDDNKDTSDDEEEEEEDDDDDLLVVKQRDVHGVLTGQRMVNARVNGNPSSHDHHDGVDAHAGQHDQGQHDEGIQVKVPKRLKIKSHGAVGVGRKVVFDDEGNATDPLQALATSLQDATPRVTRATHTGGLDVGEHADAAARFAAAQRALELRDEEDKRAAVERRRAVKQERKRKRKAALGGEEGPVAMIGGPASESGEYDDNDDHTHDEEEEGEEGAYGEQRFGHTKRPRGHRANDTSNDTDDDDWGGRSDDDGAALHGISLLHSESESEEEQGRASQITHHDGRGKQGVQGGGGGGGGVQSSWMRDMLRGGRAGGGDSSEEDEEEDEEEEKGVNASSSSEDEGARNIVDRHVDHDIDLLDDSDDDDEYIKQKGRGSQSANNNTHNNTNKGHGKGNRSNTKSSKDTPSSKGVGREAAAAARVGKKRGRAGVSDRQIEQHEAMVKALLASRRA